MKNELRKTVLAQLTSQDPETKAKIDQYHLSFPHEYDTGLLINQALMFGYGLLISKSY